MSFIWGQARFPAPEFENYAVPEMSLETLIFDTMFLRIAVLVLFLVIAGVCFYRFRSRKLMLSLAIAGLVVFGYVFTACPCPVGMFQNIAEGMMQGTIVSLGVLMLFAIPLVCALFFGRLFCAGICPLGAVQELLHWKTLQVPRALDRVLRMIPILLFLVITVMAAAGMGLTLCRYEPYLPLFLLSFAMPFALVTFTFLLVGLFVSRPFCRYVCPYGVLLRFFSIFAAKKPQITINQCINCKLCEQGCPNGAIIAPEPLTSPEVQQTGARRLAILVAITPFALFFGGVFGYATAPVIASYHQDAQLLCELHDKVQSFEVEAFESSGTSMVELEANVMHSQNMITVGMCIAGIIFAACVMAELIVEARERKEKDEYCIDASLCFCCGRCYQTCPLALRPVSTPKAR